jgi:hypothetical protein
MSEKTGTSVFMAIRWIENLSNYLMRQQRHGPMFGCRGIDADVHNSRLHEPIMLAESMAHFNHEMGSRVRLGGSVEHDAEAGVEWPAAAGL